MPEWMREVKYAARVLVKSPGFTIVAVLSLALGIGVNTAILGVARAALLVPLPVEAPDQLAIAHWWRGDAVKGTVQFNSSGAKDERTGRDLRTNYSVRTFDALRASMRGRADVFAFTFVRQASVSSSGGPGQATVGGGMLVSGNYFGGMRVPIHLGRGIEEGDDRAGAEPVAVIGYAMWQRSFGGDPSVLGRTIRVNGQPFTLVGITARDYFGVSNGGFFPIADVTLPLASQPIIVPRWTSILKESLFTTERAQWLRVMLRLEPGETRAALEPLLSSALARSFNESPYPVAAGAEPPAVVLQDGARGLDSMRGDLEQPLMLLAGVAGLVFLIACVNIAGLILVRGLARQREYWIRLALGAGRARLVRQTIVESLVLAGCGGLLGLVFAVWAGRAILATLAGTMPHAITVAPDGGLVAIAAAVSCVAAVLFGALPALRLTSRESTTLMRQSGSGGVRLRAGRALVLVQVAVAMPLVLGAALFLRTIHNLAGVELGFESDGLVIFRMDPTLNGYDQARSRQLFGQVLERLSAEPGIAGATLIENALVSGWVSNTTFEVPGEKPANMLMNRVGPGFFETIGLPLVAGRGLGIQDHATAARVGVVNEAAAQAFFGTRNPVGQQIRMTSAGSPLVEIVGVARDSKYDSLKNATRPTIYLPYFQSTDLASMWVAVRGRTTGTLSDAIVRAVAEVDRDVPVTNLKTQAQQIEETIGSERAFTTLLVAFGSFALVLACIGLHGVTAYAVARRTSEIGIRIALGAQRRSVLWLVLRQVVLLASAGLLVGIPAAIFASRAVQSLLFGVEPTDPWSVCVGATALLLVSVAAGFVPARRAARLDPLVALRRE